jgi:hypothetical protein
MGTQEFRAMGFNIGEVYELANGRRTGVVIQIHSEGRAGLLRFTDTNIEEWLLWAELQQEGKWAPKLLP